MNFRVVDGGDDDFSNIFDDFEQDYLAYNITNDELRKKYDLSKKKFARISQLVKTKHGLSKRPIPCKNYYKHDTGYYIAKMIDGKHQYLGHAPTKEMAIRAVDKCKELDWDIEKCKIAIVELKQCQ